MKKDSVFLGHIRGEVAFLRDLTQKKDMKEIRSDPVLSRAVARSLEVIGEAAKQISPGFRAQHPRCPWEKMSGIRDVLEKELPVLEETLKAIATAEETRAPKNE